MGGGGYQVPKVFKHFLLKELVNIWILGLYKIYLTVVQKYMFFLWRIPLVTTSELSAVNCLNSTYLGLGVTTSCS